MTPRRRALLGCAGVAGLSLLFPGCGRETPPIEMPSPDPGTDGALRIDLHHRLSGGVEGFALARLRAEPHWNTRRRGGADPLEWGDYRVSIHDAGDGALLFQDGFDSNLAPGAQSSATRASVRVPMPSGAVRIIVQKRRAEKTFQDVWRANLDPRGGDVDRSPVAIGTRIDTILSGGPGTKAGLAVLGDGYRDSEYGKFVADAKRAVNYLFSVDPLKRRMRDFNVWSVFAASAQSGVTDGYAGIERDTVLGCRYGSGTNERTLHARDETAVREIASVVAYDFVLVLANSRRYGGSAYFGGPAVIAIDSAEARYLAVHEFAHVIGGLADEYYIPAADGPSYRGNVEPWNPNVTLSGAKWAVLSGAPPARVTWDKAEYDRHFARYVSRYFALRAKHADEAAVERLMQSARVEQAALLSKKNAEPRRIGLYEGANGYANGMFRCEADCIMFSLQTDHFCAACTAAIERMIDTRAGV